MFGVVLAAMTFWTRVYWEVRVIIIGFEYLNF